MILTAAARARRRAAWLDGENQVVGPGRADMEAGGVGAAQAGTVADAEGVRAGRGEDQITEGGHTPIDGHRRRAAAEATGPAGY